jgi:N-acetylneuraminate synthase
MKSVHFGSVEVGKQNPPYIIAEIGSNHNGDMDLCKRMVDRAADVGAHAVKLQSWTEKTLISEEEYASNRFFSDKKKHFGTLREMVRAYQFTPEQHYEIKAHCERKKIDFCSSVFSAQEADLLEELDVPFFKIASMDVVHLELLKYVARKKRPMVISTGMSTLSEIEQAVETVRCEGNNDIVLLHCISIYPPQHDTIHLRNMDTLRRAFETPVGFSDHSLGTAIPLAAIALGACVIEQHFTLDKDMEGWDHDISADPDEMEEIVREGTNVFQALGSYRRIVSEAELEKRRKFRRSLVAKHELVQGHVLRKEDLDAKRPGTGIAPDESPYVIGRRLNRNITADQVIYWDYLE